MEVISLYLVFFKDAADRRRTHRVRLPRSVINRMKMFTWWLYGMSGRRNAAENRAIDGLTEIDRCMIFEFRRLYRALDYQVNGCRVESFDRGRWFDAALEQFQNAIRGDDALQTVDVSNVCLTNFNLNDGLRDLASCVLVGREDCCVDGWKRRRPERDFRKKSQHNDVDLDQLLGSVATDRSEANVSASQVDRVEGLGNCLDVIFPYFRELPIFKTFGKHEMNPFVSMARKLVGGNKNARDNQQGSTVEDDDSWNIALKAFSSTSLSIDCTLMYLANFYFNARRDHRNAIAVCDRVLAGGSKSNNNNSICERIRRTVLDLSVGQFKVLLTRRLMPIFDDEIQAMFGFAVLCKCRHDETTRRVGRRVSIGVCPMLFAYYIRARCLIGRSTDFDDRQAVLGAVDDLSRAQATMRSVPYFASLRRRMTCQRAILLAAARSALLSKFGVRFERRDRQRQENVVARKETMFGLLTSTWQRTVDFEPFGDLIDSATAKLLPWMLPNATYFLASVVPSTVPMCLLNRDN